MAIFVTLKLMWVPLLILFFSAWLLVGSSSLIIGQSRELAYRLKLSKLFVALVLVSLGTSLPELTVSFLAMGEGDVGLSIGNILGSNITNTSLVLGMAILMGRLSVGRVKTQQNAWLLLLVTVVFVFLFWTSLSGTIVGGMLIGIAIGVMFWQYVKALEGRNKEDVKLWLHMPRKHEGWMVLVGKILLALIGLVVSGTFLVFSVEWLSRLLEISTTVLGLTLAALATSLPELVATVIAQRQNESKIALGNILGSNIYNLAFVGGIVSFNFDHDLILGVEAEFLVLSSFLMFVIIKYWKGKIVPVRVGVGLVVAYALYLTVSLLI